MSNPSHPKPRPKAPVPPVQKISTSLPDAKSAGMEGEGRGGDAPKAAGSAAVKNYDAKPRLEGANLMPPQLPLVHVAVYEDGVQGLEAPRNIREAIVHSGGVKVHISGIHVDEYGGAAEMTVAVPGFDPHVVGKILLAGDTPRDAVAVAKDFLAHCLGSKVPPDITAGLAAGVRRHSKIEVEASVQVRVTGLQVIRADEKMSLVMDRSKPGPGHLVRLDGLYCGVRTGQMAILGGCFDEEREEQLATFGASAFCDGQVVSCSGGPVPYIALADLEPTGETGLAKFWRWRDGFAGADRGEYYTVEVPVWSWKGTEKSLLDVDRERMAGALEQIEFRYPERGTRRDCAYLEVIIPHDADGVSRTYGHGFIASPFVSDSTKRPFFHAQMVLGHSEIYGYGAGLTWDDAVADLKACLLESWDTLQGRGPTDPSRVQHAIVAKQISAYPNSTSVTSDMAAIRLFSRPEVPMANRHLLQVPAENLLAFENGYGRRFVARIMRPGDAWGLNGCLNWGEPSTRDKLGIEFYDATKKLDPKFGPLGQFMSNYYLETVMDRAPLSGLNLEGSVREWVISGRSMDQVLAWAKRATEGDLEIPG